MSRNRHVKEIPETSDLVVEYDTIYKTWPGKWESADRDLFAWQKMIKYCPQPKRVLDIGCGNGHTLSFLATYWKLEEPIEFSGIDLSSVGLRLAKRRVPEAKLYQGYAGDVKLPDKYEAVFLMGTVEHFPDPRATLRKIADYLADGGYLLIEAPDNTMDGEEGWRASSIQMEWHYRQPAWESIIKGAGYKIIEYEHSLFNFVWVVQHGNQD